MIQTFGSHDAYRQGEEQQTDCCEHECEHQECDVGARSEAEYGVSGEVLTLAFREVVLQPEAHSTEQNEDVAHVEDDREIVEDD